MKSSRPRGAQSEGAEGGEQMRIYEMVVIGMAVGMVAVETLRNFVWQLSYSGMRHVSQAVRQARHEAIQQARHPEPDKPIFPRRETPQERWASQQAAFNAGLLQAVEGAVNQMVQRPWANSSQPQPPKEDVIEGKFYILEEFDDDE